MHKSLLPGDRFAGHRNVLKRAERIAILQKEGRRKAEDSVFNLPKLRIIKLKQKKKVEEAASAAEGAAPAAEGAAAPGAAAAPATAAAAPAKGATPAKGAPPAKAETPKKK